MEEPILEPFRKLRGRCFGQEDNTNPNQLKIAAIPVTIAVVTFSAAKREFDIRYYLWAASEFEKEITEGFPNFRSFKTGSVWELHQFMKQLSRSDQLTLAHSLLKRFHPDAVKALGETCSAEEESLRHRRDSFFNLLQSYRGLQLLEKNGQMTDAGFLFQIIRPTALSIFDELYFNDDKSLRSRLDAALGQIPSSLEESIAARKRAGEKIKFVSKRRLLKVVATRFQDAFGGDCQESERVLSGDLYLAFQMKCRGWILGTHFWFGRSASLINYSHSIASQTPVAQKGANGIYMGPLVLASLISFTAWLGITSQVQWECLTDEEVEPACDAAIKLCRHFFEVAPKLLKGLEPEKIIGEA